MPGRGEEDAAADLLVDAGAEEEAPGRDDGEALGDRAREGEIDLEGELFVAADEQRVTDEGATVGGEGEQVGAGLEREVGGAGWGRGGARPRG